MLRWLYEKLQDFPAARAPFFSALLNLTTFHDLKGPRHLSNTLTALHNLIKFIYSHKYVWK